MQVDDDDDDGDDDGDPATAATATATMPYRMEGGMMGVPSNNHEYNAYYSGMAARIQRTMPQPVESFMVSSASFGGLC